MDKNKSIDGLVTHRSKPSKSESSVRIKSSTSPSSTKSRKKSTTKPKTTTIKSTKVATTIKSTKVTRTPKPTKVSTQDDYLNKISKAPITTANDFLTPVQSFNFDEQTGNLKATKPIQHDLANDSTYPSNPNNQEAIFAPNKPHKNKLFKKSALSAKSPKAKKAKKKMSKKRKIVISIILSIILLLIAGGIWLIIWGNDIIARITGGQGNVFDLLTFMDDHYEPLKTDDKGRTNLLAIGTSGFNMQGESNGGTHDGAQLTDSIMVISLDQETGDIAMLSLPRDLKVPSTCTATSKINEVYWCNNTDGNNEQAGAEALMEEVGNILGLEFQYYAHLNWGSLGSIVDTLDGITITLDEDINDYYYTGAVYSANTPYTINGTEAIALSRARHGTDSGDFSRGASQQKILIGIKDKVQEKDFSITELTDLAGTLGDNLRTNFNIEELKSLAHIVSTFDLNSIRQVSLIDPEPLMTTGTINGISYVLPSGGANYYTKIQNYVAKMFSNDPRDREDASILILNGTEIAGIASNEESTLESEGYKNIYIDDAPAGTYNDHYTLYTLSDTAPETQKLLETKYQQTAKPIDELPAGIDQFYDFVIIIGESNLNDSN